MTQTDQRVLEVDAVHSQLTVADLSTMPPTELLRLARSFRRVEAGYFERHGPTLTHHRVAISSSFSTQHLAGVLRLFLLKEGIWPEIHEGEFDSTIADVLDPASALYAFRPATILILTSHHTIAEYPPPLSTDAEVDEWVKQHCERWGTLWSTIQRNHPCQIVFSLYAVPPEDPLGVSSVNFRFSRTSCLRELNRALTLARPPYVTLLDTEAIASDVGKKVWFDSSQYFLSKQGVAFAAYSDVLLPLARIIATNAGRVRKCLVLDLDNTLWHGVIGDDGMDGINLDPTHAVGEAYRSFQRYVLELKRRGVILAVCSKNEDAVAREVFDKHEHMILRQSDISCFVANWDNKGDNVKRIAAALDISPSALVFFDDNPAEREIVRQMVPEVLVVDVPPDPAHYVRALHDAHCFEATTLNSEDLARSASYVSNRQREDLLGAAGSYDDYLRSLNMRARCGVLREAQLGRFCQLINKSNQFNLRTRRYTEAQLLSLANDPGWALLPIGLSDRFDNYGIISCAILRRDNDSAFIDTWVMSCRVLKRGVERLMMNQIEAYARAWSVGAIRGEWIPSGKNVLVEGLLPELGFELESADADGRRYSRAVTAGSELSCAITVEGEHDEPR